MRILVTGGCGFIGSHFVRHLLATHPRDQVINLDALTYAGNPDNLQDVQADYPERYRFVQGDVCDAALVAELVGQVEAVAHFAAESHVDRSIEDSSAFVHTNVLGTHTLLEAARRAWGGEGGRFLYVSTDEVYGELELDDPRRFREDWPLRPRSPYSASKAAGEMLALSYLHTHGLPVVVTRCCNNYGPNQFPEKFIPLVILNTLAGRELPVYGDGRNVREWIQVRDNCRASDLVLRKGKPGEVYNVGSGRELANLELLERVVGLVCRLQGLDLEERLALRRFVADRPGHDRRYALDTKKIRRELGFAPQAELEQGLEETVRWYLENPQWCRRVSSGEYRRP